MRSRRWSDGAAVPAPEFAQPFRDNLWRWRARPLRKQESGGALMLT